MATSPIERSPATASSEHATPNIASTSETLSEHLSYPTLIEPAAPVASSSTVVPTRPLLKDRLYVGNLHPSVDEYVLRSSASDSCRAESSIMTSTVRYTLLQAFSKFGKISKLDFLFHKSGPLKGKPRGYAFVEYSSRDVRPCLHYPESRADPGKPFAWHRIHIRRHGVSHTHVQSNPGPAAAG